MMEKIEKEFCLTDSSVNCYGYRLLTDGIQLDRFKPAIGHLMHERRDGVAVIWTDFRFDGDRLYAKPTINSKRFPNLAEEILNGFYAAASVGMIVAQEVSGDASLMLDGQTGPTVTKWFPREISIVDIPANYNALANLYAEDGSILYDLSANYKPTKKPEKKDEKMNELTVTPAMLAGMNLAANASQEAVSAAFSDLAAKAARAEKAEKELADLKAKSAADAVESILADGLKNGVLTKEISENLKSDYKENPEGLRSLVAKMPKQTRVTGQQPAAGDVPEKYRGKTFNDLYVSGEMEAVKKDFPEYYEQLKKEANGSDR